MKIMESNNQISKRLFHEYQLHEFNIDSVSDSDKVARIRAKIASQTEELTRLEDISKKLEKKMKDEEFDNQHHSNHLRDHLNSKLERVSNRIESIRKLINKERNEITSESLKLTAGNNHSIDKHLAFSPPENEVYLIVPKGV